MWIGPNSVLRHAENLGIMRHVHSDLYNGNEVNKQSLGWQALPALIVALLPVLAAAQTYSAQEVQTIG